MDNYNINRKVVNFKDFDSKSEKEELKKVRRSTKPNSEDQQHIGNSRFKFNKVTRKMDDLSPEMIDDNIEDIEELEEMKESKSSKEFRVERRDNKTYAFVEIVDGDSKNGKDISLSSSV